MNTPCEFGPQFLPDGRIIFRLWAPSAKKVDLICVIEGKHLSFTMQSKANGWFCRTVNAQASSPSSYFFQIDQALKVPDPASRQQDSDVHGPSRIVFDEEQKEKTRAWRGRPWRETIIYELHVGTFTEEGTFAAAAEKVDYLAELGISAIQLMPVSDFPGNRNWGYDGVLPFAPAASYGTPSELRCFIEAAHARHLMVFLDVVYNHFGPEGNYLYCYAKPFFTGRRKTPWGKAINFDGRHAKTIRRFFIENALYWLEEYGFDGLRFDAVHAIFDTSPKHFLYELGEAVHEGPGRDRYIHLMLENDANESHLLRWPGNSEKKWYAAQWNDDMHHAFHTLLTGETSGYYQDFGVDAIDHLGRCLSEGFAWQGEPSPFRGHKCRGEPSHDLPPTAFISFLQNHDQIGNRAFGERLHHLSRPEALKAATAAFIIAPSIPMIFMGQEWAAPNPFLFFCDFEPSLAGKITAGRRREFSGFPEFSTPRSRTGIPDPASAETFRRSKLNWQETGREGHRQWHDLHRHLFYLRREKIIPLLDAILPGKATYRKLGHAALQAEWKLRDGQTLHLQLNLGEEEITGIRPPCGDVVYASAERQDTLPPLFAGYYMA